MRIAIYAATFVPNKDGVAKTLHELVSTISKEGHEMAIWSSDVPEDVAKEHRVNITPSLPVFAYPAYRFGFFRPRNAKELDEFDPDIIHISTPDIAGLGFLRYGRKRKLPVSSVFHTDFPSYMRYYHVGFLKPLLWSYLKHFYNACDIVLAPTKKIEAMLKERGVKRTGLWSRGIHNERYNPSNRSSDFRKKHGIGNEVVYLFSGRFVHYKGLDVLISTYERMMREYGMQIKFLVIGSGPEEHRLKERMPEAVFPGYLTGVDLYEAYASSDIFLFPSTTETFGNVVLEAMASGLPCIVSDKGGCQELVNGSKGGLVSISDDVDSFVENCKRLLNDLTLRYELKNNAIEFSKTRSWDVINCDLLIKYDYIIKKNNGQ
ncbi:MAG: glycosyltransferase family 1 protein [Candidatus Thermoplasmatota archaeon]|nr:glycosyltransferase family 1 protein [Candidatus Thermoplasmatota archaeon]